MNCITYKIICIPDITLTKNRIGANSGLNGIMKLHNSFLRIWNRKGLISSTSLHLLYEYVPSSEECGVINCYLMMCSENEIKEDTIALFETHPLVKKYKIERIENIEAVLSDKAFSYCTLLMKNEVFTTSTDERNTQVRYTVPEWKMNGDARLYEMFTVMTAINKHVAYRIDLYPVDYSISLRNTVKTMSDVVKVEREKNKVAGSISFDIWRDREMDKVVDSYDQVASEIENSPHYIANIFCFSDDVDDSKIVLDSAAAEAIDEGSYKLASFVGKYNLFSMLESHENNRIESIIDSNTQLSHLLLRNNPGWKVCRSTAEKYVLNYLPVLFTLCEAETFFRFPIVDDGETIQMKLDSDYEPSDNRESIIIGTDSRKNVLKYPLDLLNKHAFISGVPGSGKTYTMLHLVTELHKNKIPFLVMEPAKKEYRAIFNYGNEMADVNLFSPHMNSKFPLQVNPFEFPKKISLCEHINVLMKVFSSTFDVAGSVYSILDKSISAAYEQKGWDDYDINDGEKEYPSLMDVYKLCVKFVNETDYESDIKGNIKSFIEIRLEGLMKRDAGEVFNTDTSTMRPEEWLSGSNIVEMEDMGEQNRNFLTLLLCNYIREDLKVKKMGTSDEQSDKPNHVIFIEEAHNLIADTTEQPGELVNPKISATKFIVDMLAEVRALKESIVIADQLPSSMAQEVMKNTGLKIALRMTAKDERDYIGGTISASPVQVDNLSRFEKGKSLVFFESLEKPLEIQIIKWNGSDKTKDDPQLSEILVQSSQQYKRRIELLIDKIESEAKPLMQQVDDIDHEIDENEELLNKDDGTNPNYTKSTKLIIKNLYDERNELIKRITRLGTKVQPFYEILDTIEKENDI